MDCGAGAGGVWREVAFFRATHDGLTAYARHQFRLGRAAGSKDGRSEREHLELAAKAGHKLAIAKLRGPSLPAEAVFAWVCFCELDRWRGAGGFGMAPLTLHDVAAYEARYDLRLDAETIELVKAVDHERLAASAPAKEP